MNLNYIDTKVLVTSDFYKKLIDDMENFGFKTLEDSNSQASFFRDVIIKTYEYQNKINKIEKIKSILADNKNSKNIILNEINKHKNDENFNKCLTDIAILLSKTLFSEDRIPEQEKREIHIKSTKSTYYDLLDILNDKKQLKDAEIFKGILYDYMNYPLYTREKILFGNFYNEIKTNIKNNITSIITTNKGKEFEIEVYDIISGKSEFHYYVTGFFHEKSHRTFCIKLCNIKSVRRGESYQLTNNDITEAKNKLIEGAEWFGNDVIKTVVKLTDKGVIKYNSYYVNRPSYVDFDETTKEMTFMCSEEQIKNYFLQFGRHALIINNPDLKEIFYKHHKNAYDAYEKSKTQ